MNMSHLFDLVGLGHLDCHDPDSEEQTAHVSSRTKLPSKLTHFNIHVLIHSHTFCLNTEFCSATLKSSQT